MKSRIFTILIAYLLQSNFVLSQTILRVGPGQTFANPSQAAAVAEPGDSILIYPGVYNGPFFIVDLHGTAQNWISIRGLNKSQVIFQGGSEALHFTDPLYVNLSGITITGQTGNGINIDDGGTFASPAKHMKIYNCIFRDMAASGNNDMLKLSGLDSFTVSECHFENGSAGGSGIDMVGCHYGVFVKNRFINQGSNSIQAKGGSSNIHIERNYFTNGGQRALNLGGSTGLQFFRPAGANYEAKDLLVTANVFEGSDAPIAYVGCRNSKVINNTIIQPVNWIMRILQESSDTSFFQSCANNTFSNNIVIVTNTLRADVNIGPFTSPSTFTFANNLWYNFQNTNWNGPQLPAAETGGIVRQNPQFKNYANKDYSLANNSPAIGKGKFYGGYVFDFNDKSFLNPPSIGAFEKDVIIGTQDVVNFEDVEVIPNPCNEFVFLKNLPDDASLELMDLNGRLVLNRDAQNSSGNDNKLIKLNHLKSGIYILKISNSTHSKTLLINII
jgi:hypothetical protein